jgi:hypothetical protein
VENHSSKDLEDCELIGILLYYGVYSMVEWRNITVCSSLDYLNKGIKYFYYVQQFIISHGHW